MSGNDVDELNLVRSKEHRSIWSGANTTRKQSNSNGKSNLIPLLHSYKIPPPSSSVPKRNCSCFLSPPSPSPFVSASALPLLRVPSGTYRSSFSIDFFHPVLHSVVWLCKSVQSSSSAIDFCNWSNRFSQGHGHEVRCRQEAAGTQFQSAPSIFPSEVSIQIYLLPNSFPSRCPSSKMYALITKKASMRRGVLEELQVDGIDISFFVVSEEGNSSFTYIIVDNQTKTRTCIHTPGWPPMIPSDISSSALKSALDGVNFAYFDVRLHETALVLAHEANRRNIPILIDAERLRDGLDEFMYLSDYVVCSSKLPQASFLIICSYDHYSVSNNVDAWTEAPTVSSALVSMLLKLPKVKFVIVTLGADGCIMLQRSIPADNTEAEEMDVDNLVELLKQKIDNTKAAPTCVSSSAIIFVVASSTNKEDTKFKRFWIQSNPRKCSSGEDVQVVENGDVEMSKFKDGNHMFCYGSVTTEFATESLLRILQQKDSYGFYNGSVPTDFATEYIGYGIKSVAALQRK
ncbi:hypothetical protein LXL04_011094 [Taraxacum kok-saghyz]